MEEKITYLLRAENDFEFLKSNHEHGILGEPMCYVAQNTCERYLKHVIDLYCYENSTTVMKTHSLRNLRNYISQNLPEFMIDWDKVLKADGFYFAAMYPGDDAILVTEKDVQDCWDAIVETRNSVINFLDQKRLEENTLLTSDVIEALNGFDD